MRKGNIGIAVIFGLLALIIAVLIVGQSTGLFSVIGDPIFYETDISLAEFIVPSGGQIPIDLNFYCKQYDNTVYNTDAIVWFYSEDELIDSFKFRVRCDARKVTKTFNVNVPEAPGKHIIEAKITYSRESTDAQHVFGTVTECDKRINRDWLDEYAYYFIAAVPCEYRNIIFWDDPDVYRYNGYASPKEPEGDGYIVPEGIDYREKLLQSYYIRQVTEKALMCTDSCDIDEPACLQDLEYVCASGDKIIIADCTDGEYSFTSERCPDPEPVIIHDEPQEEETPENSCIYEWGICWDWLYKLFGLY